MHYRSRRSHGFGRLEHHQLGNYIELDGAHRACGELQRNRLHHLLLKNGSSIGTSTTPITSKK